MMKRFLIIFGLTFFSYVSFGQFKSIYGQIRFESFVYKKDSIKFDSTLIIPITKEGCTDIIPIGRVKNQRLGIKIELLRSHLGLVESFVVGQAYFVEQNGKWKELYKSELTERPYKVINDKKDVNQNDLLLNSVGSDEQGFESVTWESYYVIK